MADATPVAETVAASPAPAADAASDEVVVKDKIAAKDEAGVATKAAGDQAAGPPAAPYLSAAAAWISKSRTSVGAAMPNRGALLAAGLGFVAGAGLLIGTMATLGVGDLFAAQTAKPAAPVATLDETRALTRTIGKLDARVAELSASVKAFERQASAQRSQVVDRNRQGAQLQTDMQTRLAKISDAVERLDRRVTAAAAEETTGSVAPRYAAAAAAMQPPPAETTAPPSRPDLAEGWVIRHVSRGRALVADRGRVFEAAPGLRLPGLGFVEEITRRNGRWVVVTERGTITAIRRPRAAYGYAD